MRRLKKFMASEKEPPDENSGSQGAECCQHKREGVGAKLPFYIGCIAQRLGQLRGLLRESLAAGVQQLNRITELLERGEVRAVPVRRRLEATEIDLEKLQRSEQRVAVLNAVFLLPFKHRRSERDLALLVLHDAGAACSFVG